MRVALSFLTRLPVGTFHVENYYCSLGRQTPLFPLVGLMVGAVALAADAAASALFGPGVRSVAAVAATVWVTGALHLDGLMDTADGVGSNRSPERMLEIMKDSRVGAMGAIAGALLLLARFAFLLETPAPHRWQALLLAPALGRMAIAAAAGRFPAAGGGLGAAFAAHVGFWQVAGALASGLALAVVVAARPGVQAFIIAIAVAWLTARTLARKLGGLTGDTYGAINELTELAVMATFAAHLEEWPW